MSKVLLSRNKESAVDNIRVFFFTSMGIALMAAVLRAVSYFTSFEDIGYFDGGFLPKAVTYFIILGCAYALLGLVFISKDAQLPRKLDPTPNSVFFSSCFAGFILLADFAYKIFYIAGSRLDDYIDLFDPDVVIENAYFAGATAVIELIGVLSALFSAVYFFLSASKRAGSKFAVWLGFFPIVRALVGVASIYFEMEVQMNHPSKLMLQFALISAMFYLLCEQRFGVSEDHPRPRAYFVSGCVSLILNFVAGVSELAGFFGGYLNKGDFAVEAFFCFTLSLYIIARLNSFVKDANKTPEPEEGSDEEPEEVSEDSAEEVTE